MADKYQIAFINLCIRAFSKRVGLPVKNGFQYLYRFKGINFLLEFYSTIHLQSIDDAVAYLLNRYQEGSFTLAELANELQYKRLNRQYHFGTVKAISLLKRIR